MKRLLCAVLSLTLALGLACPALASGEIAAPEEAEPETISEPETPLAGPETVPAEEETVPTEPETPPAEAETPAAAETPADDVPPTDVPPPTDDVPEWLEPPAAEITPPAEEETAPPAEEEIVTPPVEETVPPVEDPLPAAEALPEQVICVDAPLSARVVLNPYRMKVRLGNTESDSSVVGGNEVLRNYSPFPVRVEARAAGTPSPGSGAVFVSEPPAGETAERAVFMYLEFQNVWSEFDQPVWSGQFLDLANQIRVNGPGKADVLVLAAGGLDAPGYGMFRLCGEVAPPAAAQWTGADTVDVSVAFSFTPADVPAEAPLWLEPAVNGEAEAAPVEAVEPAPVETPEVQDASPAWLMNPAELSAEAASEDAPPAWLINPAE